MTQGRTDNDMRLILKRYLSQYHRAKIKQRVLQKRLLEVREELKHPSIGSAPLGSIGGKSGVSAGAASLVYREAEIEARIQRQVDMEAAAITNIMDILNFLPADSTEKLILELRHIDCRSWSEISRTVHLSRSPCYEYYNKGLDKLLTFKKVCTILSEFETIIDRPEDDSC